MSWAIVNLGDVATFLNGYPFKPTEWATEGLEIIRIQNLTKGSSETNYFKGEVPAKYKIVKGDILISWSATLDIFVWDGNDAWLNQHIFKVVFDKIEINKQFFIYLIKHILDDMRKAVHGATMQHITKAKFDNLKVPLPPLPIQKRIAEILDAADALKRKDQALLKKYDELAQAIFIDMFGDPVKNEKGWEEVLLKDIVHPERIITYGIVQAGEHIPNGVPYIKTGDIKDGEILIEQLQRTSTEIARSYQRSQLFENDIVMSIRATVGTVAILPTSLVGANLTQGTARISPSEKTSRMYLYYYLKNEYAQNWIASNAKGATFREITLGKLRELPVLLPHLNLQLKFEKTIYSIIEGKQKTKIQVVNSNKLFKTLIQKAFKGELVN